MSLESKIDQLIKAVEANTQALLSYSQAPEPTAEQPKPEPEQTKDTAPEVTHKEVQDAVLAFVRKDTKKHKPLVRTLLDGFEAQKVSDLDESRLPIFMKQLKALEE